LLTSSDGRKSEFFSDKEFHGPLATGETIVAQIVRAWQLALARQPTADELQIAAAFVARQTAYLLKNPNQLPKDTSAARQALTNMCQALLISNEFLYLD